MLVLRERAGARAMSHRLTCGMIQPEPVPAIAKPRKVGPRPSTEPTTRNPTPITTKLRASHVTGGVALAWVQNNAETEATSVDSAMAKPATARLERTSRNGTSSGTMKTKAIATRVRRSIGARVPLVGSSSESALGAAARCRSGKRRSDERKRRRHDVEDERRSPMKRRE